MGVVGHDVVGRVQPQAVPRREQPSRPNREHDYPEPVILEFSGEIWFWRGPAPWHFITVPEDECRELERAAALVSYGWGMIPVEAQVGGTAWTTSLFPKDGRYIVPVKAGVRKAEGLEVGETVAIRLAVAV